MPIHEGKEFTSILLPFICLGSTYKGKCELSTLGDGNSSNFACGCISNIEAIFGIGVLSAFPFNSIDITSYVQ